ncbi:BlaI/MecI/CopY family transcriptional regulator [Gimesia maris]|uniref:Penicillinase repressor n=1 Tax=Gimesia maris TaxID=122 RepID=A0ABX5YQR5_9PLAN|nr:BlaI/MecI/CopY family transcriptional regulator [Gimesia maris]EDL59711.1 putative transcriptional regulator [Gimesia maris DSM 8797]QEG17933.1 Penicillinase repressor [Gimesia maris]QGQ29041.1 BlaI/MecI/CopY family transcriptional regulator [Gimesia maris]
MANKSRDVTEAELSVLQVLWCQGPLTIRGITEILEPQRVDAYYSTVKKLLERLETKGFVKREPAGIAFTYEATIDRDDLVGRRLQEVAETLCEGSLTPLLTQLAQHHDLSRKQQKVLMDLIDDLAKQNKKP